MDELPKSLLLEILSRLDDSADVARCRVASKAFNTLFPDLRSINLLCPRKWRGSSSSTGSSSSLKKVFVDLLSKLRIVESVRLRLHLEDAVDEDFAKEWLPRVSPSLKSLSLSALPYSIVLYSNVLPLISTHCLPCLFVDHLNPMPMLTSLTLECTILQDHHLNQFNKCFPNLQLLKLVCLKGLKEPKIHLLNLQTCHWVVYNGQPSLTLITPNLLTLRIECSTPIAIHVEAPVLSRFYLRLYALKHVGALTAEKFQNLKTLWLDSMYIDSVLSEFPITKTVTNLTLDSGNKASRDAKDSKLTLGMVFTTFPNLTSLCIKSNVWSELEACLNPEGWEILDGRIGLKTICAYLKLVDPSLTFSYVAFMLDRCKGLSEVSFLIHAGVVGTESNTFMSKCMARWPGLKWRWGVWSAYMEDSWITDGVSDWIPQII
ncbi:putative F-box protein AUF1 [Helianthus annuus]|nr:putative leucine-rich repeat domain superfamily, F-box-like domain superfamily [Helianthus annuus]KAJ0772383.1 putative F-box protein AUF1 [Helianthus annuus]KAJ0941811.1 putative leucine-rich repeat domain superfamily, F-box-like domain superfamily [Helianthus annuus]